MPLLFPEFDVRNVCDPPVVLLLEVLSELEPELELLSELEPELEPEPELELELELLSEPEPPAGGLESSAPWPSAFRISSYPVEAEYSSAAICAAVKGVFAAPAGCVTKYATSNVLMSALFADRNPVVALVARKVSTSDALSGVVAG